MRRTQGPAARGAWWRLGRRGPRPWAVDHPGYRWVALSNTTLGMLIVTVNASIILISLPAVFRGIGLDPLAAGNVGYLLWMIMGYLVVSAVLVVSLGRLGDMLGRVRIYNLGFVVFTAASIALALTPGTGAAAALWIIGWRLVQAVGGSMLFANSAAILTDAFPLERRGMALGINQIAAIAGSFIGLVVGGVLSEISWRAIFWVSVPIGVVGTLWSYHSLHESPQRRRAHIDWAGNLTFAVGLSALLAAITYGIQPYGGHPTGWTDPWVVAGLVGGILLLASFCLLQTRVPEPMFNLGLFRDRSFALGNLAGLLSSVGRGGLQFMLIIWLQGIWLPLHGYDFAVHPAVGGHLPAAADRRVRGLGPGLRAGCPTGTARAGSRSAGMALTAADLRRAAAGAGGLRLPGVRRPDLPQRGADRGLFSSPNAAAGDERGPGGPAGCGRGHAWHVLQRRVVAVDRRVLLADGHRPGRHPAGHARRRADAPTASRGAGRQR